MQGGGRLPTVPCDRFHIAEGGEALYRPWCTAFHSRGGTALYRPQCSVLYGTTGQLSTVTCVWFYLEVSVPFGGGDGV